MTLILILSVATANPMVHAPQVALAAADPCADNVAGGDGDASSADSAEEGVNTNNPCVDPPRIAKPGTLPGPSPITDTGVNHERYLITDLIPTLVRGAINLLAGITIVAIMYGGIQYLTAYGDDTKLENAKKNIIYAVIGLLIAMFSYTIVRIISEVPLTDSNEIPQAESQDPEYTP